MWPLESKHFAMWLADQAPPGILPNQVGATANILDRVSIGDLLCVMFHADKDLSLKALNAIKTRYEGEMYALNEMNATRDDHDAIDWG